MLGKGKPYFDNFNYFTPFGNLYAVWQDESIPSKPKKSDEIFIGGWVETGSVNFEYEIHTHLNKKFRMRMIEISKSDYSNLCQYQWELTDGVYLSGTGMRHYDSINIPNFGMYYLSLLIRTKKVPSELVWNSVAGFLEHMGQADEKIRPLRCYLRVSGNIGEEKSLKHLELMKYRKSKCTHAQLERKWSKYAYKSKLEVPFEPGEFYWVVKPQFYKRPNRDWDDNLPRQYLLDEKSK